MENPQAFPSLEKEYCYRDEYNDERRGVIKAEQGMTLLDYFAGLAMQGFLSSYSTEIRLKLTVENWQKSGIPTFEEYLSIMSYEQGMAMLKQREKIMKGEEHGHKKTA